MLGPLVALCVAYATPLAVVAVAWAVEARLAAKKTGGRTAESG
jgi:hypothetical protein